jgi:sarcosine oxidase, subunit beta
MDSMSQTYDAIIIGSGVVGNSIAFHLAERGLKPVVIERKSVASGATGRSSGLVRMHYDLEIDSRFAWVSFQYFINWRERVGGECGFIRTGFLQIEPREHVGHLRGNVELHKRIGINTSVISAEEVRKLVPAFVTDNFDFAAYEPDSGYADPTLTANSFLNAAKARGATLIQDCPVTGILTSGGRVTGVKTMKGDFSAPVMVDAAGAWAGQIAKLVGVDVPLKVWTHDVAFLRRPPVVGFHPTVIDGSLNMYFRPEGSSLTLAALEDDSLRGDEPDADSERVAPDFVDRLVSRICRRMPLMEQGGLHSTHVGRDGLTPDQRAILDQAGPDGFYIACGFSGTGFKTSPAVGKCMAELILDGQASTIDITPLGLMRFARGELLKGEFDYGSIWK